MSWPVGWPRCKSPTRARFSAANTGNDSGYRYKRGVTVAVEAVRGQVRWGVGSLEQAFGGYKALPEVGARRAWWEVLGVAQDASLAEVAGRREELLFRHHPDHGGSQAIAAEINAAFDEARAARAA